MLEFPNISEPVYPLKTKWENPVIASKAENGTVITRAKFTRIREEFTLSWNALKATEYIELKKFWRETLGGSISFHWRYPNIHGDALSGKTFVVRFASEEPTFELSLPGYYEGSITLVEV